MSVKKKPIQLFILVFTLVLFFGFTGSFLLRSYNEKKSPEKFIAEKSLLEDTYESFPQLLSHPPRSVVVDANFVFTPRVVPADNDVKISLLDAPAWLNFDGVVLSGVPREEGTVNFVLRIEKNGKYVDQDFYLVVMSK